MRVLFLLSLAILLMTSCEKDEDSEDVVTVPVVTPKLTHMPLNIGNYWVYQKSIINSEGEEIVTSIVDSVVIVGDTTVLENSYFKFVKYYSQTNLLDKAEYLRRDSLGYLIDEKGEIFFSQTISPDTINSVDESIGEGKRYTIDYFMENYSEECIVPAGTFIDIINFKGNLIKYGANNDSLEVLHINNLYAEDIGKVYVNFFYFYTNRINSKKLLRYRIVPENITN